MITKTVIRRILKEAHSSVSLVTLDGPVGRAQVKRVEDSFRLYFGSIQLSFPMIKVLNTYRRALFQLGIEAHSGSNDVLAFAPILGNWIENSSFILEGTLTSNMTQSTAQGQRAQLVEFANQFGMAHRFNDEVTKAIVNIPPELFVKSSKRTDELAPRMNQATLNSVNAIISKALEEHKSPEELARDLSSLFNNDFMETRSNFIASNETNIGLSLGAFDTAITVGADKKDWITVGDERVSPEICMPNEGQGRISILINFQSGHMHPSGHHGCRCVTTYHGVNRDKVEQLLANAV